MTFKCSRSASNTYQACCTWCRQFLDDILPQFEDHSRDDIITKSEFVVHNSRLTKEVLLICFLRFKTNGSPDYIYIYIYSRVILLFPDGGSIPRRRSERYFLLNPFYTVGWTSKAKEPSLRVTFSCIKRGQRQRILLLYPFFFMTKCATKCMEAKYCALVSCSLSTPKWGPKLRSASCIVAYLISINSFPLGLREWGWIMNGKMVEFIIAKRRKKNRL